MRKTKDKGRAHEQNAIRRQFEMLRMLERSRKTTVQQLRSNLERLGYAVTDRTIQRDLRDLSAFFPLISDERSKPHGWQWKPDAPVCDFGGLTLSEALAFQMLSRFGGQLLPAGMADSFQPYFKAAQHQLHQISGPSGARNWVNKIRSVPPSQPLQSAKVAEKVQQQVHDALMNNRCVRVRYRSGSADMALIHPLGLVEHNRNFYLVVRYEGFDDVRLLAMHRIRMAELSDFPCTAPDGFDLDEYIALGGLGFGELGKTVVLKARFFNGAGRHLTETPLSADQKTDELADGQMIVTAMVGLTQRLRWWLLGFGDSVEVLEPAELREDIYRTLREAVSRYAQTPN